MATRIHLHRLRNANTRYETIKSLYREIEGHDLDDIEELVHWAVNQDMITHLEGDDILEFLESGELNV